MSRLGSGVPSGTFSGTDARYSRLLKVGGSSLTSMMVIVTSTSVSVSGEPTGRPLSVSKAWESEGGEVFYLSVYLSMSISLSKEGEEE